MKIYSWNVLFRNKDIETAFAFIRDADFDIFCLQEVPESLLMRLKSLPYSISYAVDVDRLFRKVERNYLVILSRGRAVSQKEFSLPDYWARLPLRTRIFVHLMRPFHFSKIRNRSSFYADIETPSGVMRVFCLHLILAHPTWRLEEFERAMSERDPNLPTVVCGDFNILESPKITLLNWLLGGRMSDAVRFRRERTRITERFVSHGLVNPLQGQVTHPFSRSQLDHILLSHHLRTKSAHVLPDPVGSDHHPILVEAE